MLRTVMTMNFWITLALLLVFSPSPAFSRELNETFLLRHEARQTELSAAASKEQPPVAGAPSVEDARRLCHEIRESCDSDC